jgi:coenzyme F420-reducing hydrogenase delta subunit
MSGDVGPATKSSPRILVFSTNNISDPGIDLAGSRHLHYSATVSTITVPCSSAIQPAWILHAIEMGFDGVFLATDGDECAYLPDCNARSARIAALAQDLLRAKEYAPQRVRMAAICSVCAESFVKHMEEYSQMLVELGPAGERAA